MSHLFDLELLDAMLQGLLSPERILAASEGVVTDPDTEVGGLAHMELSNPVCLPACSRRVGLLLGLSARAMESLLLYSSCLVTDPGPTSLQRGQIIPMPPMTTFRALFGSEVGLLFGAEAAIHLLEQVDLERLGDELSAALALADPQREPRRYSWIMERLMAVESYRMSRCDPLWAFTDRLPVVPSFLRPELPEPDEEPGSGDEDEDGEDPEFSSEERYRAFRRDCCIAANCDYVIPDLHEHYKRILYRSRRLVRVQELHAPGIIILHDKRTLQAAVNALIDNRHAAERATDDYGRELESLYDMFHFLPEHPPIPGT